MKIYIIQFVNYTLSFFMWMILGRVVLSLFTGNPGNFAVSLFSKVTDPFYRLMKTIMPFAKGGWIPFLSIVLIIILRLSLIILFGPAGDR